MDLSAVLTEIGNWFVSTGLRIAIIAIVTLVVIKGVRVVTDRLSAVFHKGKVDLEAKKRADTLVSVVRHLLTVVIVLVVFLTVLGQLGIEIGPVLAAAGIVGLAVGFGAQNLIKDVLNGFFILLEDQIRVGDWVQIADKTGLVERVNLKMSVIRDLEGKVHFIPNGSIDVVTNLTKDFSRYVFDIGVAYREDTDEVVQVIKEVDRELRKDPDFGPDILKPIQIFGLDKFADSAIVIKARYETRPAKHWRVGREFKRRLKKKFDQRDIEIPFPHLTLYHGEDKKGEATPMRVLMNQPAPD